MSRLFGILDRYIARAVLRATALTLAVLVVLLSFVNLVEELDRVNRGDYGTLDALLVALLGAPRYLFEVFPVAALLGSLLGLGALASRSELVAMRAAGHSVRDILFAVLKVGLLMMLAALLFSELVAPPAEQYARDLRARKLIGQETLASRYGFWARDGRAFVNIRSLGDGRTLRDLYLYEFDAEGRLRLATHAARADHAGEQWVLRDLSQTAIEDSETRVRRVAQARWVSRLDPALLSGAVVRPTMLPLWELADYIAYLRDNAQSAIDFEVAFWLKVVNPFATLAMLLLAVPFVLGAERGVGTGQRIFVGAVTGAVFFLMTRAFSYVAVVYQVDPALTAFVPAAVFLGLGAHLLRRVR